MPYGSHPSVHRSEGTHVVWRYESIAWVETSPVALFSEPRALRVGPLGYTEPRVNWFLESTRLEAARSRAFVNEWYSAFPDRDRQLAARLRSADDITHLQALDELFIHHLLSRPGRTVNYEECGVGPDFRVYEDDDLLASVEVASLFERSDWASDDRRHGRLADELNRRLDLTDGYIVDFQLDEHADTTAEPAPASFARWVRREIGKLPRVTDGSAMADPEHDVGFPRLYESRGLRIRVRFWAMDPENVPESGEHDRIVGTGMMLGGVVIDAERVRDRVSEKAGGKYDLRSAPFLVVVGVHAVFCDDGKFINGLYGSPGMAVAPDGSVTSVRASNGVFGPAGGKRNSWKNRRLSAVCRMSDPNTWEPANTSTSLFRNPSPDHELPKLFAVDREFGLVEGNGAPHRLTWLGEDVDRGRET